jgi:putative tryptophan/tyrosine transport system substrate-binding protein
VIGFLSIESLETSRDQVTAFRRGLSEAGYVEGQNVTIEYRWAESQADRLPALAADLVRRQVATIAATGGDFSIRAAKAATATIPIVFSTGTDPVQTGLVASLNRPGGNVTGVTRFSAELMPKRLELLCEAVPNVTVIDMLVNPEGAITASSTKDVEAAARLLGRQVRIHMARNESEIDAVFATLAQIRAGALLIMSDTFFSSRNQRIGALTVRYAIPAIYQLREFPAAGGLMSYDSSLSDSYHQVGVYIGRILNGEKPADLPVQKSTKAELFINLKTAKALGITVPLSLLGRADEVIE